MLKELLTKAWGAVQNAFSEPELKSPLPASQTYSSTQHARDQQFWDNADLNDAKQAQMAAGMSDDNVITNRMVRDGELPPERAEIYPQMPQNRLSPFEQRRQELLAGFGRYGATPSAEAVDVMAAAPDQYEVFARNPYLLPTLSIVETSAGQHMTRPKHVENPQNLMNWGIDPALGFNPTTQQEAVERAMTGIGERSPYYQPFRESGKLEDFVNTYAPASDGNEGYLDKLLKAQSYFQ